MFAEPQRQANRESFATMDRRTSAEDPQSGSVVAGDAPTAWRFGDFRFDTRRGELTGLDGAPIALRPKTEQLLRQFLARPGERLGREELMAALWPAAVVTDDSLVQCVSELRAALGDRAQRLIRTLPRWGYRFEAVVAPIGASAETTTDDADSSSPAGGGSTGPQSVRSTRPAAGAGTSGTAPSGTSRAKPSTRRHVAALFAAAALVGGALLTVSQGWLAPSAKSQRIDETMAARHVTAVVPFVLAEEEPRLREIADRVADQIAAQIAAHPGMPTIGRRRTEMLSAVDRSPGHLASALHASYAITGRVAAVPGRPGASVAVQVLALPEGAVIGSAQFDAEVSADATSAGDIGELVTMLLRGKSGEREAARASAPGHVPDATDLTVIGWQEITRMSSAEDVLRARSRFQEALRHDPESVAALTGLVASYQQARIRRMPIRAEDTAALEAALDKAMKIAPDDANVALLWALQRQFEGRPDLAIPSIEKANRLVPSFPNGHLMLGLSMMRVGRFDEAQRELDRAIRLALLGNDPRRASRAYMASAEIALMLGDDEHAAQLARRSIATGPSGIYSAYGVLAAAEALSGHLREAADDMATYRGHSPQATIATYDAGHPSSHPAFRAARARLFDGLRTAGLPDR